MWVEYPFLNFRVCAEWKPQVSRSFGSERPENGMRIFHCSAALRAAEGQTADAAHSAALQPMPDHPQNATFSCLPTNMIYPQYNIYHPDYVHSCN